MVSQPDHYHSSVLTLRGPSAVLGSGGVERLDRSDRHDRFDRYDKHDRHHHSHSHHGGGGGGGRGRGDGGIRGGDGGGSSSGKHHGGGDGSRSTTTLSRSRRYNRSHAGGASYVPQNEFPVFSHSGDVEILVRVDSGHENRYLLHRHTLTRCSGFFEASTSNEWSRAQNVPVLPSPGPGQPGVAGLVAQGTELARIGEAVSVAGASSDLGGPAGAPTGSGVAAASASVAGPGTGEPVMRKRWRYELDHGPGDDDIPMLVQKEESSPAGDGSNGTSMGPANSIFGGGGGEGAGGRGGGHISGHSFFRSVANLGSLAHHSPFNYHAPSYSLAAAHQPQQQQRPLPPPTPAEQDLLRDYDNLFRIMYNYPPLLDGVNIADAYVQCKSLLALADQYDALAVVGPRVDHHLLQFQSRLWRQIAKYPISYLRLGYMARSRIIFQEALIHVVGQWPSGERSIRHALPAAVVDLIEDKVDELEEEVSRAEARLFRLGLTTRAGDRVTPHTAYLDWLAVSLFRQWLADNTAPPPSAPLPQPPPPLSFPDRHRAASTVSSSSSSRDALPAGGSARARVGGGHVTTVVVPPPPTLALASLGRTYRTLGGGGPAYLGHDECKRFLKLSGELYSRDNLRRFEKRVDELKAMAREVVRPLMGSGLELDMASASASSSAKAAVDAGVAYLTCTRVGDRDLPWSVDE